MYPYTTLYSVSLSFKSVETVGNENYLLKDEALHTLMSQWYILHFYRLECICVFACRRRFNMDFYTIIYTRSV